MALQMGQEQSPEDLPTLSELGDSKEVDIGGRLILFGHGDSVDNEQRAEFDRG